MPELEGKAGNEDCLFLLFFAVYGFEKKATEQDFFNETHTKHTNDI